MPQPPNQNIDFDPTRTGAWAQQPSARNSDLMRLEERFERRIDRSDHQSSSRLDRIEELLSTLIATQVSVGHLKSQVDTLDGGLEKLKDSHRKLESTVQSWVNKGFGAWAVAIGAIFVVEKLWPK